MNDQDLKKHNLNQNYQPLTAPVAKNDYSSAIQFEDSHESVQGQVVIASKVGIQQFVKTTIEGRSSGNFSSGSILYLSTSVSFGPPNQNRPMAAMSYMSLYQGTVETAANQIYPNLGTNVTLGRYIVQGALDWNTWGKGARAQWRGILADTTGTSLQVITYVECWQYLDYTVGATV